MSWPASARSSSIPSEKIRRPERSRRPFSCSTRPCELGVQRVLEAVLAFAVRRHEAEQGPGELAPRVVAAALALDGQAADAAHAAVTLARQRPDLVGFLGADLAFQPGEPALAEDPSFHLGGVEPQHRGDAVGGVAGDHRHVLRGDAAQELDRVEAHARHLDADREREPLRS